MIYKLSIILAISILQAVLGTGCGSCNHPTTLRVARCTSNDYCPKGTVCDTDTQTCVDVCAAAACALDQMGVTEGTSCTCLNVDGVGSPCVADGDCAAAAPFASVARQVCRSLVAPIPGWPTGKVCVPDAQCVASPLSCADPDASDQIEAQCVPLNGTPTAACSTACVNGTGPSRVVTPCRFDQVPKVAAGACSCVPREDPYGRTCSGDADCGWPSGLLGNAGPTRTCRQVAGGKRCVPTDFCTKDETTATCVNGADDDCDGVADADEVACLIEYCKDRDGDGYCDMGTCGKRKAEAGNRARTACIRSELTSCDSNPGANPGIPERCNRTTDDNCDGNVDEICQTFCRDGDGDSFQSSDPQVYSAELPGPDWTVCSAPFEHPTCDADVNRHQTDACGPIVIQPPPPPPAIVLRMFNVDDEAYAWLDQAGEKANAMCSTARGAPPFDCDLAARLRERGRTSGEQNVVVKILNSGCWNAQGWFELLVDGAKRWESSEHPDVRHCGWVFRHNFFVDPATGSVRDGKWDSCELDGQCN